eukprot:5080346-Pyramimonas_sp.AAC.1
MPSLTSTPFQGMHPSSVGETFRLRLPVVVLGVLFLLAGSNAPVAAMGTTAGYHSAGSAGITVSSSTKASLSTSASDEAYCGGK